MNNRITATFIAAFLMAGATLADSDCTDPVADWQPKEKINQMVMDRGWTVNRIKVDDGCYEVKAVDRNGHNIEAVFSPASLDIMELEVKFHPGGDTSDYFPKSAVSQ